MHTRILIKIVVSSLFLCLIFGCNKTSYVGNYKEESMPDKIDVKDIKLINALNEKSLVEEYIRDFDFDKEFNDLWKSKLTGDRIIFFPEIYTHFTNLNPDSITKVFGKQSFLPKIISFQPSMYVDSIKEDETYYWAVETFIIYDTERLTPILSRIDEFTLASLTWRYDCDNDIIMNIVYLLSDTTMVPIDGVIASKYHKVFGDCM